MTNDIKVRFCKDCTYFNDDDACAIRLCDPLNLHISFGRCICKESAYSDMLRGGSMRFKKIDYARRYNLR